MSFDETETIKGGESSSNYSLLASEIIKLFTDVVSEQVSKYSIKTHIGQVTERLNSRKYRVRLLGEGNQILMDSEVTDLKVGDYVEILDTENNLSTSYIARKRNTVIKNSTTINRWTNSVMKAEEESKCWLQYNNSRWYLVFSSSFYYKSVLPFLDKNTNNTTLHIGVARVLSKKSGWAGMKDAYNPLKIPNKSRELYWKDEFVMEPSRRLYSLPEYIGIYDKEINRWKPTGIRTAENFEINKIGCTYAPMPIIDVTDIINNSIFEDDYVFRHTVSKKTENQQKEMESWYKKFGIFVMATHVKNDLKNKIDLLYVTPLEETYTVTVYSTLKNDGQNDYYELNSCRNFNENDLTVDGVDNKIYLGTLDMTEGPESSYRVKDRYIILPLDYGNYTVVDGAENIPTEDSSGDNFKVIIEPEPEEESEEE